MKKDKIFLMLSTLLMLINCHIGVAQEEASEKLVAYWPLNEGSGKVLKSQSGGVNGGFLEVARDEPVWSSDNELVFKGGRKAGKIKIIGGGKLLSGPFFKVSVEVKSNDLKAAGYILSSKAQSTKNGGFLIYYWGNGRKLIFNFADGFKKYSLTCKLKNKLPLNKWVTITALYNGSLLTVAIDDKIVGSMSIKGALLAPARDLVIGGYINTGEGFYGGIRNVKLAVPKPSDDVENIFSVKNFGIPKIDGKLDDAVWQKAKFYSNFVYFYKGKVASPQTELAISVGKDKVYFAIRCFEPNINKLVAPKHHPSDIAFSDDLIEIFLDPDISGDHYIHLALTAGNFQFQQVATHFGTRKRSDFSMKWDSAVNIGKDSWTVEIAIPYSELMVKPGNPGNWHINIGRANQTLDNPKHKWTTWGSLNKGEKNKGFHNAKLFNTVTGFPGPNYNQKTKNRVKAKRKQWKLDEKPSGQSTAMLKIRDYMFVANNLVVPNWFVCLALGKEVTQSKTYHIIDIPQGIELLYVGRLPTKKQTGGGAPIYDVKVLKKVTHNGKTYSRYKVTPTKIHPTACFTVGPLYMRSSLADNTKSKIYYQSVSDTGTQKLENIDLITRKFPTPGMPKKIISALAWMHTKYSISWPDFLGSYPKLGFNTVPSHRQYDKYVGFEKIKKFLANAKRNGLKIMETDSTFYSLSDPSSRSIDPATGKPSKNKKSRCPAYRGPIYRQEIQKVVDYGRSINADIYNLDIESFHEGAFQGKNNQCTRCMAYFKKNGKGNKEGLTDMGAEIMGDIKKALIKMSKEENRTVPYLGAYHTMPGGFVYSDIFDFDKMAKKGTDFAHPTRYASKNADDYGRKMRKLRAYLIEGDILPWLTAGYTVGNGSIEFPSEWVYNYVIETYGSGLRGTYWFSFIKFEGCDMYYFAKAMESVVSVAELIWDSKPVKGVTCNKASVSATAIKSGNSYIILLSDYTKNPSFGSLTVTLPKAPVGKVWDLARQKQGGKINGRKIIINNFQPIEKNTQTALYYVGEKSLKWSGK